MSALEAILDRLESYHRAGTQYYARCPAHNDSDPSLTLREADDGRVLIHCFAGCGAAEVLEALNLSLCDLFPAGALADYLPPCEEFGRAQPHRRLFNSRAEARSVLYACALARAEGHVLELAERQHELSAFKYLRRLGDL